MPKIWVKVMKKHRIAQHETEPCAWDGAREALEEVCKRLDIPVPMWLNKHEREFDSFRRTVFAKDHFVEDVWFDQLEMEFLEDGDKRRKSEDPRNAF